MTQDPGNPGNPLNLGNPADPAENSTQTVYFTVLRDFGQFSCATLVALEARGGSVEASRPPN